MSGWTENKIQRYFKEGRGQGEGESYKSWLSIEDLPRKYKHTSIAMSYSWKNIRAHYILSELDLAYFYMLEWDDEIIDIRENYPLDLTETLLIAKKNKITHMKCSENKIPIVMTTTFLTTKIVNGEKVLEAIDVEYLKNLNLKKTQNQMKIKKSYWERKGIKHRVVTEENINVPLSRNIFSIHSYRYLYGRVNESLCYCILNELLRYKQELHKIDEQRRVFRGAIIERILKEREFDVRLIEFNKVLSKKLNLTPGDIFQHVFFLIANKIIKYDMENKELSFENLKIRELDYDPEVEFKIVLREKEVDYGLKHKYSKVLKTV